MRYLSLTVLLLSLFVGGLWAAPVATPRANCCPDGPCCPGPCCVAATPEADCCFPGSPCCEAGAECCLSAK